MKQSLLKYLKHFNCGGEFDLSIDSKEKDEVKNGRLICKKCGVFYPIKNCIPRFVEDDDYADNFSLEWTTHSKTQLDSINKLGQSLTSIKKRTCIDLDNIVGHLHLDVGCGMGRFEEVIQKNGGEIIGFDISYSVDAAFDNVGHLPGVHIVQANVFELPFKKEIFDHIFSIGVLHHTPSTKKAFQSLLPFLKKGGDISIWVYNNWGIYNTVSDFWRFFSVHLPNNLLYKMCKIFVPLIYFFHKRGKAWRYIIPVPIDLGLTPEMRILNTFDWYSPRYQWKHTDDEVKEWFNQIGLGDVKVLSVPVSVCGRK